MAQLHERPGAPQAPDVDRKDEVPIGIQFAWRLRALILSGRLGAGDRLPGVRELAAAGGVNVNTARSIYRRLEDEGLAVSRHGLGTFVAADAATTPVLEHLAAEAAEAAKAAGIEPRELARTLYAATWPEIVQQTPTPGQPELAGAPTAEGERAARHTLRAQIARLEAELAPYAAHLELSGEEPHPLTAPIPHVAGLGELEATRDQLLSRLQAAREAAGSAGARQGDARERLRGMVEDPAAHKWSSVSNQELGEPGCTTYDVQPAWGPVGALMNWWRVKVSSGCPLTAPA